MEDMLSWNPEALKAIFKKSPKQNPHFATARGFRLQNYFEFVILKGIVADNLRF